jgi:hypothetical protein
MDANFRLKLRQRGIKNDGELGPGWSYFSKDDDYQTVMAGFGDQAEVRRICDITKHEVSNNTIDKHMRLGASCCRPC